MTDILNNPPAPPARNRMIDPGDIHFISKEHALVNTPSQFETLAHWMQERVGATR